MSATNCSAPNEQKTTSKLPSAKGSAVAVPQHRRHGHARSPRRAAASAGAGGRRGRARPTGRRAARTQREHWPAPRADLEHVLAGHVAEHPGLVLGEPLGAPDEAGVAEERRRAWPGTRRRSGPSRARWPAATRASSTGRRSTRTRCGRWSLHGRDPTGPRTVRAPAHVARVGAWTSPGLTPLAGGWSGETFLAEAGGERSVVRIYRPGRRDDAAPEIDAAVLRAGARAGAGARRPGGTTRGRRPLDRPGCWSPRTCRGTRGDLLLPTLDDAGLGRARRAASAGSPPTWPGMPTLRPGPFVDADLRIGAFGGPTGCRASSTTTPPRLGPGTGRRRVDGLVAVAERAQDAARHGRPDLPGALRPQPQEPPGRPRTPSR